MKAFQYPIFFGSAELAVLQHHLVYAVLSARIRRQTDHAHSHRHAPPGGRSHHTKIESPRAFAFRQSIAQHVVIGMADEPLWQSLEDLSPIRVSACAPRIVGFRETGRR